MTVCDMLNPFLSSKLIDSLSDKLFSDGKIIVFYILAVTSLSIIITYFHNTIKVKLINDLCYKFKRRILNNYLDSDLIDSSRINQLFQSQNLIEDSYYISEFIFDNIFVIFFNLVMIIYCFIYLYFVKNVFLFISILSIPVYVLSIGFIIKPMNCAIADRKNYYSLFNSTFIGTWKNDYNIKITNSSDTAVRLLDNKYVHLISRILKEYKIIYFFYSIEGVITLAVQTIFFFLGIIYLQQGEISLGQFTISLTLYTIMIAKFRYLMSIFEKFQEYRISQSRMKNIYIEKKIHEDLDSKTTKLHKINKIHIKPQKLHYDDKTIDFPECHFLRGGLYQVKGINGVGKTSLFNAIYGLYHKNNNSIEVNDYNLSKLDKKIYRQRISYLTKNPIFIDLTYLENLQFFYPYLTEENTQEILKSNGLLFLFDKKNLFTKTGDLSNGQKQKLLLIITLLKEADVYLLDEPLSYLDKEKKEELVKFIENNMKDKLRIVIDHENYFRNLKDQIVLG